MERLQNPNPNQTPPAQNKTDQIISKIYMKIWENRWHRKARQPHRTEATWSEGWANHPLQLYEGAPKHVATAIFLLRSQVLGLRAWLANIGCLDISPEYNYGASRQIVHYILTYYPLQTRLQARLIRKTGTTNLLQLLRNKETAGEAARWLLGTNLLEQFKVAQEIEKENTENWAPFDIVNSLL